MIDAETTKSHWPQDNGEHAAGHLPIRCVLPSTKAVFAMTHNAFYRVLSLTIITLDFIGNSGHSERVYHEPLVAA